MFLRKIFNPNKIEDVFTPNTVAKLTYVGRNGVESDLVNYLNIIGKQIFIYGHSGSGKTTLLRNQLKKNKRKFILTHCEAATTFEELILQTFDQLERYYTSERTIGNSEKISADLKTDFSAISRTIEQSSSHKKQRLLPPQLTPQKLARFLGEINSVWIVEDFHKVAITEKKRIADVVKIFIDSANDFKSVKIICIGAVGTARELIELDSNLSNRVAELEVPLLSDSQISQLITKGCKLLNIKISDELINKIVYYSNNLASVAHGLCYDICLENEIRKEGLLTKRLNEDSFARAVNSYVRKNSDTFKKIFDEISNNDLGKCVLHAFESSERDSLDLEEIFKSINETNYRNKKDLEKYLELLSSLEYKEIIRYDYSSKKYSISSPLFKTFLKMKMELDRHAQVEIHRREINKKNKQYSLKPQERELVFDDAFFELFNSYLDQIIKKRIEEKKMENVRNIQISYKRKLH